MDGITDILNDLKRVSASRQGRLEFFKAFALLYVFIGLVLCLVLLGAIARLSPVLQTGFSFAFLPSLGLMTLYALRRWKLREKRDIENALDRQSDMRVFSALRDRPSALDAEGLALWSAHRKNVEKEVLALKPLNFKRQWRKVDPFFVTRLGLPSLVLACLLAVGPVGSDRLKTFFLPDIGLLFGAHNIEVVAWVTPPDYTQTAPIYLDTSRENLTVPENSILTVRVKVGHGTPRLILGGDGGDVNNIPMELGNDDVWYTQTPLLARSTVSIKYWGTRRSWNINVLDDASPKTNFVETPKVDLKDRLLVDWVAEDDFGVIALALEMRLRKDDPNNALKDAQKQDDLEIRKVELPLQGPPQPRRENLSILNLTRHAWAGLGVEMRLRATDEAGQEGFSRWIEMDLPEYIFIQPLARAIQEVRSDILRESEPYDGAALDLEVTSPVQFAPQGVVDAVVKISDLLIYPDAFYQDETLYFGLEVAKARVEFSRSLFEARQTEALLWQAAMRAELGSSKNARDALEAARKALDRGLRNRVGASTLRRLVEAYKQAAQNYLAARMAEGLEDDTADANTDGMASTSGGQQITMAEIAEMMARLEELTNAGKTEEAAQLLAEITKLLEQLEFQQGQGGSSFAGPSGSEGGDPSDENESEPSEFEKDLAEKLAELSDLLRQQREVNDDTLAEQRAKSNLGREGTGQPGAPGESMDGAGGDAGSGAFGGAQSDDPGEGSDSLLERQKQLRELAEQFGSDKGLMLGDGLKDDGTGEFGEFGDSRTAGSANSTDEGEGGGAEDGDESAEIGEGESTRDSAGLRGEEREGSGVFGQTLTDKDMDAIQSILQDMLEAEQALERDNLRKADNDQNKIIGSMRDLSKGLSERLDDVRSRRLNEGEGSALAPGDPLGRSLGSAGIGDDVRIPERMARQRAKNILEQIRKRYTETESEEEREYLETLLDQF